MLRMTCSFYLVAPGLEAPVQLHLNVVQGPGEEGGVQDAKSARTVGGIGGATDPDPPEVAQGTRSSPCGPGASSRCEGHLGLGRAAQAGQEVALAGSKNWGGMLTITAVSKKAKRGSQ